MLDLAQANQAMEASMQHRNKRKALITHVFQCLQPTCTYRQCATMRRKLHKLVFLYESNRLPISPPNIWGSLAHVCSAA